MKKLLVILAVLFTASLAHSQSGNLGKTKQEIIDEKGDCEILANKGDTLTFLCNGKNRYFRFDAKTSLCKIFVNEFDKASLDLFTSSLKMLGYIETDTLVFIKKSFVCKIVFNERGNPTAVNFSLSSIID